MLKGSLFLNSHYSCLGIFGHILKESLQNGLVEESHSSPIHGDLRVVFLQTQTQIVEGLAFELLEIIVPVCHKKESGELAGPITDHVAHHCQGEIQLDQKGLENCKGSSRPEVQLLTHLHCLIHVLVWLDGVCEGLLELLWIY